MSIQDSQCPVDDQQNKLSRVNMAMMVLGQQNKLSRVNMALMVLDQHWHCNLAKKCFEWAQYGPTRHHHKLFPEKLKCSCSFE